MEVRIMLLMYVRKGGRKKFRTIEKDGKTIKTKRSKTKGGIRVGVIVALKAEDGSIRMGWSLCNRKAGDKFNAIVGVEKAVDRTMGIIIDPPPQSMRKKYNRMAEKAGQYFKVLNVDDDNCVSVGC